MAAQGWCPSTYRIHAAPDGGLVRVRAPGGILALPQVRAVAMAARRWGNGVVELTNRANLQLRGVDPDAAGDLRSALAAAGLVAPTAIQEDRRNVLASPTAGFDPDEVLDVRPLVATVVAALDALPAALAVPHKVGVLVDGGGHPTLRDIPMDLAIGARRDEPAMLGVAFGCSLDATAAAGTLFVLPVGEVARLVEAVARCCARPPAGAPGRLREVIARLGPGAVADHLAYSVSSLRPWSGGALEAGHPSPGRAAWLGVQPGCTGPWLGVAPAGPVLTADDVDVLVDVVADHRGLDVRLTPWRSVILPGLDDPAGAVAHLADAGWSVVSTIPVPAGSVA